MKKEKQNGTIIRMLKQLFLGGLIGAIAGGLIGFSVGYFELDKNGLPFTQENVISVLLVVLRVVYVISLLLSVVYIVNVLRDFKQYQTLADDDSEELYRAMGRKHSYAAVFNSVATMAAMVSLILSFKLIFGKDEATLFFPILDFVFLLIVVGFQAYILKVYNRIRDIKMPLVPTLKELKANIMQLDEAELEANYKMSFDIVMNLNSVILPAIYLILFFWSIITQEAELTGILVAASIHLYLIIKNFKMTREYYK